MKQPPVIAKDTEALQIHTPVPLSTRFTGHVHVLAIAFSTKGLRQAQFDEFEETQAKLGKHVH
jgi:hypothetical protein